MLQIYYRLDLLVQILIIAITDLYKLGLAYMIMIFNMLKLRSRKIIQL